MYLLHMARERWRGRERQIQGGTKNGRGGPITEGDTHRVGLRMATEGASQRGIGGQRKRWCETEADGQGESQRPGRGPVRGGGTKNIQPTVRGFHRV